MKALIFGANGQDGHFLNELLQSKGIDVTGVSRSGSWINGSVNDYPFVRKLIKTIQPDLVFHLAANSTTRHEAWLENHETICNGTLYILESVKEESPHAKVFISGSGLQFENKNLPIDETSPFMATSPYAVSRIHSTYAARYYRDLGIRTYVGYFFNHDSPLRSERHMSSKIAEFAKRVAAGSDQKLAIGDINVRKEWGFAGDIAEGIWTLVSQEAVSEAAIGTGKAYSIADWLDLCFSIVGADWANRIETVQGFSPEYQCLVSNPTTMQQLGWQAHTSFSDLAGMMLGNRSLTL